MRSTESNRSRLPKGVTALSRPRGGRWYRASIRKGKGAEIHLGLYQTAWFAAFAYGIAARALGRPEPRLEIPPAEQPDAEDVREITAKVRRRLGVEKPRRHLAENPPGASELLTLFEVTVIGFWRSQASGDGNDHPGSALDAAASRVVDAANLLFWSRSAGHPEPLDAMSRLLGKRLEQAFRRSELTREVLDDDGDDPWRVARWLAHPDVHLAGRFPGFRDEIRRLYPEFFESKTRDADDRGPLPSWAQTLGIAPPFDFEKIRAAFRTRSRTAHPDGGGTDAEFVRLREAYEDALAYCGFDGQ